MPNDDDEKKFEDSDDTDTNDDADTETDNDSVESDDSGNGEESSDDADVEDNQESYDEPEPNDPAETETVYDDLEKLRAVIAEKESALVLAYNTIDELRGAAFRAMVDTPASADNTSHDDSLIGVEDFTYENLFDSPDEED